MPLVATVLIDGPSELECSYAVPEKLEDHVMAGSRVHVPLGPRRATGTIVALEADHGQPRDFVLKPLGGLIENQPILSPALLELARWMADYYISSREAAMRCLIPEAVRAENTAFKQRQIVVLVDPPPAAEKRAELEKRAPKQATALAAIEEAGGTLPQADLPADAVKALLTKGFVRVEKERLDRDPHGHEERVASQPLVLNAAQKECLDAIVEAMDSLHPPPPLLLFGVTGSGKTEIYLQAVQETLDRGKSALVLVPEISLTPQTVERFKSRFASMDREIAVLHSHLSTGERHDEWHKAAQQKARIVIGARSAIFAPLKSLGLIIVDEEHEGSYKQDKMPRYHARDLAVVRGRIEGCPVVLGSATPSLESWHNAQKGKYRLLTLKDRIDGVKMPLIRVIDMKLEKRVDKGAPLMLSEQLRLAMQKRLDQSEQTILFLNRRGYAGAIQCPACGEVVQCPHCSVSLVFHKEQQRLICHICGYQALPPRKCKACGDPAVRLAGFGTERVEETLKRVFPKARVARIDGDSMNRKHQLRETLDAFRARKVDIIVGTQMIAKGLHFPAVTLVGILNADLGLHIPDFRAGERTFQLLTQVAGRAGRGDLLGEVIVQTFSPHHASVQHARHHDFEGYAAQEMEFRQQLGFPPYGHAMLITVKAEKENLAQFSASTLHRRLATGLPDTILLGEPVPSPLQKAEDHFRFQIMMRAKTTRKLAEHLRPVLQKLGFGRDVSVSIDVDPHNLS